MNKIDKHIRNQFGRWPWPRDEETARIAEELILTTFPGNYTVKVCFENDSSNEKFSIFFAFETPGDELLFRLRWS